MLLRQINPVKDWEFLKLDILDSQICRTDPDSCEKGRSLNTILITINNEEEKKTILKERQIETDGQWCPFRLEAYKNMHNIHVIHV